MEADKIFINGHFITMNDSQKFADYMAVKNGKILAIGKGNEWAAYQGDHTECIDLSDKTVIPGFYDAHSHMSMAGCVFKNTVLLGCPPNGDCKTIDDCKKKLKTYIDQGESVEYVIGWGYDDTEIQEKRPLYKEDLDEVSKEIPILIFHVSGHVYYGNSKLFEISEINEQTEDPVGGKFQKNEDGSLNGVIEETALQALKFNGLEKIFGGSNIVEAIAYASDMYAAQGITTANEGGAMGVSCLKQIYEAVDTNMLKIRMTLVPFYRTEKDMYAMDRKDPKIKLQGVKIIGDGSIQAYTAYLTKAYHTAFNGDSNYRGYPTNSADKLAEIVEEIYQNGYQTVCHCNGDATIDDYLSAVENAQKKYPKDDDRPIVIHAQTARLDQIKRMKELKATPSFFGIHTYYWGDRHVNIFLGLERGSNISPMKWALDEEVPFSIHCDTPVVPQTPLLAIWAAVTRLSAAGNVIGEHQCIDVYEALKAHTIYAAYQYYDEDLKGSLEVGKYADFVVLNEDILSCDKDRIKDIQVLETYVDGNQVFKS